MVRASGSVVTASVSTLLGDVIPTLTVMMRKTKKNVSFEKKTDNKVPATTKRKSFNSDIVLLKTTRLFCFNSIAHGIYLHVFEGADDT